MGSESQEPDPKDHHAGRWKNAAEVYVRTLPEVGSFTLNLRARPKQPARRPNSWSPLGR